MRTVYSYLRLVLASCLFLGGVALLFGPTPAALEREARWRDRQLQNIPADERSQWLADRDALDARSQAYLRVFGVLLGGIGLATALGEAAYQCAWYVHRVGK